MLPADSQTLLIIDDEPSLRQAFRHYLEDLDYRVLEAENGRLGLELITLERPDLVLVDLRMPEVDGFGVLESCALSDPDLPIIVVSGTGVITDVIEALRLGAWDYLLKPIADLDVLRHAVEKVLQRRDLMRENRRYHEQLEQLVDERTGELREANERLKLAAAAFNTRDAIVVTDRGGRIERVNHAFTSITGYNEAEVLGQNPRLLKSGQQTEAFYHEMWARLNEVGAWQGRLINRRKDGSLYPVWVSISGVTGEGGDISHYVAISTDLTQLEAQRQRIEAVVGEEKNLAALLSLSLTARDINTYLQNFLYSLLGRVDWLALQHRGGVFLLDESRPKTLTLVAQVGMGHSRCQQCEQVRFGECLCGRVARDERPYYTGHCTVGAADGVDGGDDPHGHYIIPVFAQEQLVAVLQLYLPAGHEYGAEEEGFLQRVADVLGMGLARFRAEQEIEYQALHDTLTGLPNRRLLHDRLAHEIDLTVRLDTSGALLLIDLDRFQQINDSLGHPVGDALLVAFAERLEAGVRSGDTVARLGGDEFAVLLSTLDEEEGAKGMRGKKDKKGLHGVMTVLEKLRLQLEVPYVLQGHSYHLTFSAGIALYPEAGTTADECLRHADAALFEAKSQGRNTERFFRADMQAAVDERLALERHLRNAITRNEMRLVYQPQVDVAGRLIGAEALLRWTHPELGVIPPFSFIPVAEESGMIVMIGEWVLSNACQLLQRLSESGLPDGFDYLSVNISPRQFHHSNFVDRVLAIVDGHPFDNRLLQLEITEGVLFENVEVAIAKMALLRKHKLRFSIDDFGTGYSSMAYLKRLPVDEIKIDKSFVDDIGADSSGEIIVDTIIAMARHLDLHLVAEGVEYQEQFEFLKARGEMLYQGYLFHKPMEEPDFIQLFSPSARPLLS